jgi:hypothetical protein
MSTENMLLTQKVQKFINNCRAQRFSIFSYINAYSKRKVYVDLGYFVQYLASLLPCRIPVFPTRLLTSEDEYKWYWHQMIYIFLKQ